MNRQAERDWSMVVVPMAILSTVAILAGFAGGAVLDRWLDHVVQVLSKGGVLL